VVVGGYVQAIGVRVAEIRLNRSLELEVVLEAAGDDAADPPALALEQAVEHRGARVDAGHDPRERSGRVGVPVAKRIIGRAHETNRFILGCRLRLADDKPA
jgi:hypothetical protein